MAKMRHGQCFFFCCSLQEDYVTSLKKHVSNVSATCFHHLRRLRLIRRMLTAKSAATIVHAFVTSRVDYCNVVLAGAPKIINDKLQRVMNAAARVLTGTRKFDRGLTQLMHDNFLWLDVPEHVVYKVNISTRHCLIGSAPRYLAADSVILGLVMIFSVKV